MVKRLFEESVERVCVEIVEDFLSYVVPASCSFENALRQSGGHMHGKPMNYCHSAVRKRLHRAVPHVSVESINLSQDYFPVVALN